MLLKQVGGKRFQLAEANPFNTSGAYNEFPKWGRRPKPAGPIWGGAAEGRPHYYMLR